MSFEEQIMSKDKYPSMFSKSNGVHFVYYPSNIFRNRKVLKIGKYHRFSWGIFGHATRLDQSHASENI